jgi:hypothetical protein
MSNHLIPNPTEGADECEQNLFTGDGRKQEQQNEKQTMAVVPQREEKHAFKWIRCYKRHTRCA